MNFESLILDRRDGVATITLNRPDAFNALTLGLGRELFHAALEVDEDPSVRCVVVTGAGKAFCAGGDVKDFADNLPRIGALVKELTTYLHGAVSRLCRSDKPVITAVNGVAAGGGFSFALCGDLVVAAESARFTMAYSKIAATDEGLRRRQAPLPPVHVGEPRDADGARGAGDRRERPHRGLRGRRDGVRREEAADLQGEVTHEPAQVLLPSGLIVLRQDEGAALVLGGRVRPGRRAGPSRGVRRARAARRAACARGRRRRPRGPRLEPAGLRRAPRRRVRGGAEARARGARAAARPHPRVRAGARPPVPGGAHGLDAARAETDAPRLRLPRLPRRALVRGRDGHGRAPGALVRREGARRPRRRRGDRA